MTGRRLFVLLCLGMACGAAGLSLAMVRDSESNAGQFKVKRQRGSGQVWSPLAVGWEPLRNGQGLSDGSLISLSEGDKVTIVRRQGEGPQNFDLSGPFLVRLSSEAMRKIELTKNLQAQAQRNAAERTRAGEEKASFDQAWRRIQATLLGQDSTSTEKADSAPHGASMSTGIDMFIPQTSLTLSGSASQELRVSWSVKSDRKLGYRLKVRRVNAASEASVTETTLDHHYIPLNAPGTYVVQVESADGTLRSIEHKIEVLAPIEESTGEGKDRKTFSSIKLLQPANGFRVVGLAPPIKLKFRWIDRLSRAAGVSYQISVTTPKGVRVAGLETFGQSADLSLNGAGTYLWYVERHIKGDPEQSTVRSVVETLVVEKNSPLAIRDLLRAGTPVSAYLVR